MAFTTVDSQETQNLAQLLIELGSKYGNADISEFWYGRVSITDNIKNLLNIFESKLQKQISFAKSLCSLAVCADIWSDNIRHNSYLDVTAIFVTDKFETKHAALAFTHFDGQHTGENIKNKISSILNKFDVELFDVPFVTDSAANMRKASESVEWYPCFAHKLNTCVGDSFNEFLALDDEISRMWVQMIDIRSYINRSSDNSDLLSKKLPMGSITRPWSGYYKFILAFHDSFDEIEIIAENKKLKMPTNRPLIKMLLQVFGLFEILFKKLQTIDQPSLHFVIVEIFRLRNTFKKPTNLGGPAPRMKIFCDIIISCLEKKYISSIKDTHIIAVYLHPNYRDSISNFQKFGACELDCSIISIKNFIENYCIKIHKNNDLSENSELLEGIYLDQGHLVFKYTNNYLF